jgi:hypothetical protein
MMGVGRFGVMLAPGGFQLPLPGLTTLQAGTHWRGFEKAKQSLSRQIRSGCGASPDAGQIYRTAWNKRKRPETISERPKIFARILATGLESGQMMRLGGTRGAWLGSGFGTDGCRSGGSV